MPVSAACSATTGLTGRPGRARPPTRLRARRATAGSIDHPVVAQPDHRRWWRSASAAISSSVSGSLGRARAASRSRTARRGRTAPPSAAPRAGRTRPRPGPGGPARRAARAARRRRRRPRSSASRPWSSRSVSSSASSTIRSGTGSRSSRSSGAQAAAASRSATLRPSRARPGEAVVLGPRARAASASTKWVSSSTSWAWGTTTTPPPSSTSSGASTRSASRTSVGQVVVARLGRCLVGRLRLGPVALGRSRRCVGGGGRGRRPGHGVGDGVEQLADQRPRRRRRVVPAWARAPASARTRSSSSGWSGPTRQESPASVSRIATGGDQLHRQQGGAAEQPHRRVGVLDPHRPGEHRDRPAHRHPDRARRARRTRPRSRAAGAAGTQVAWPCNGTKLTETSPGSPTAPGSCGWRLTAPRRSALREGRRGDLAGRLGAGVGRRVSRGPGSPRRPPWAPWRRRRSG